MKLKQKIAFSTLFFLCLFVLSPFLLCLASEPEEPKLERHFVFDSIPLNLEEIEGYSDRIFSGICIKREELENDPESNLPVVKYIFKITEGIKGVNNNKEIIFKQWKPTTRSDGYEIDKKYVLFLYPNSERGLTSTVGVDQGYFEVETEGLIWKKEVVKNKRKNLGLTRNLRTQKKISIKNNKRINDYIQYCSESGKPIKYREFIEAVKYLVEK